jgi:hypothetical protein
MRRGDGDTSPTPREDDTLDALIRETELHDRIDALRGGPLRARTREIHSYLIAAAAFALLGVGFGPPGFIVAAILLVLIIVPYTRRMGVRTASVVSSTSSSSWPCTRAATNAILDATLRLC